MSFLTICLESPFHHDVATTKDLPKIVRSITSSRVLASCIFASAALVALAVPTTATANALTWVGGGSDNLIIHPKNWDPHGRPNAGNSGVVAGAAQTGYSTGKAANLTGYKITYKETSSLGVVNGSLALTLVGGAELTFQDNSVLKVGQDLFVGYHAAHPGGSKLSLEGNATASIDRNLIFGLTGSSGSSPGTLELQGNSSVSVEGVMEWQQPSESAEVTHTITLADSAKLTIKKAKSRHRNGAVLVINFQQTDKRATPTLTLGGAYEYPGENIRYQINGEDATLSDRRFKLSGATLSLVVQR